MKIIHTSDIHIDSPLTSKLSASASRDRKREIIRSFRKIIDDARNIGAVGIIIAGDLFDNDRVGFKTLEMVVGIIQNASDISFFYLPGNHEKDRLTASGVEIPDNLKIFGKKWTYYKIDNVTIVGKTVIEQDDFSTLKLNDTDINIVTLHGELSCVSGAEKISVQNAAALPIDYLALGHYHSYSETKLSERGVAVYSGTPEGRGFDETGDKGYVIIDTDRGYLTHSFKKHSLRNLHITEVDISGAIKEIEIENRVADALANISKNDMIRVVLVGEYEPGMIRDTDSLVARFAPTYFYLEVKDQSKLRISADDYKNDKSLKGEFIRLVISKEGLSDEEKSAIIECGIRALAGETL
ncbi:MAG: DNA repair exonuclease [Ruminococcaceae bacterium]|nr:DNA repair exonuclease [Oscillospiraceae bacterium]